MRIAVTGSIATDHLMMFAGKFTDTLIAEKLDKISVSYLVGELQIRRGGVAGNIAYGMGCLGLNPLLVGSVGQDFGEYATWLTGHGVDTSGVRTSASRHTARFTATNDESGNQIASFYPGAMSEDGEIDIVSLARANAVELVVIGAGDPAAMRQFTADCRAAGLRFAADFSQQVAFLDGEAMRTLIEDAAYLFCNEYEEAAIEQKTGWSSADILDRADTRIITLGSAGARVERKGADPVVVGPVKDASFVEPTGAGDAFRSGFLAGISWGLPTDRAIQLGNLIAVHALESVGPQEYALSSAALAERAKDSYGEEAAAEIAAHLPGEAHRLLLGEARGEYLRDAGVEGLVDQRFDVDVAGLNVPGAHLDHQAVGPVHLDGHLSPARLRQPGLQRPGQGRAHDGDRAARTRRDDQALGQRAEIAVPHRRSRQLDAPAQFALTAEPVAQRLKIGRIPVGHRNAYFHGVPSR